MKQIILLLLAISFVTVCRSQTTTMMKPKMLTEHTVVKDTAGNVVPYAIWSSLMQSQGYSIKVLPSGDTSIYTLNKLSGQKRALIKSLRVNKPADTTASAAPVIEPVTIVQKPAVYVPDYLPRQSESFRNGDAFKFFKDKDINGEKIDINALKGKIVVLNFWFINCPACRSEMPELNKVVADYANDPDVIFVGLCLDQKQKIKDFIAMVPFNFKHIADAAYYGNKYSINLYPTTLVLDKQGIIRFNAVGADNTGYWVKKTIEDFKSAN
ncbi:TlpA family protein disulfide reductase [Mucilaginibacter terrigena]|uniref:TlpA family protein disulfide reductase n=1 Tax=Mucilaginibacter terrigena TaxID=2492395 RepID=A0A4Q5LN16_9SPHI|nr:TlpA disulfide reductase family protein [Mucilaginibacter terrigena]RYU90595.1 TlpA family protein disulfide reductase [Mucilaginibacter terrigena]